MLNVSACGKLILARKTNPLGCLGEMNRGEASVKITAVPVISAGEERCDRRAPKPSVLQSQGLAHVLAHVALHGMAPWMRYLIERSLQYDAARMVRSI